MLDIFFISNDGKGHSNVKVIFELFIKINIKIFRGTADIKTSTKKIKLKIDIYINN